jgi:DNA-binding transcriptional regulator GbsR (MarR family)
MSEQLEEAKRRFLDAWGEMGPKWGIQKSMAQIHALLMVSERPLSTDDVMEALAISRGNANTNLRSLADWGLVRRVFVKGDRKEYFQSEKDVWNMFCRIARERKKREIEPAVETLRECLDMTRGEKNAGVFRDRVQELLELMQTLDFALGKIAQQERSQVVPKIMKLLR